MDPSLHQEPKERGFGIETSNCGGGDCSKGADCAEVTLSGTAFCTETDLQTVFCWDLVVNNCEGQLGKTTLSFDIRSFRNDMPFSIGPGVFATATYSITAESGVNGTVNTAYAGTGVFYTVISLPSGSTTFTICAAFEKNNPTLCISQLSPSVFTLRSTAGSACRKNIQISAFIAAPDNCATCNVPHVFCDFITVDKLPRGAEYALADKLDTTIPVVSNEGSVYEVTSFIINGNEQMGSPFYYTILNVGVTVTSLPNPHAALIFNQNGGFQYLANFNLVFGGLFESLNLENNWKAIINPDFDNYKSVDVVRIVYPINATSWSITMTRHDGTVYTYQSVGGVGYVTSSNGFDTRDTQYQYCNSPQPIDLTATALQECYYVDWDRTDVMLVDNIITNQGPITWTIKSFVINGITLFNGNYSYVISNLGQLTKNQPSDQFYNNNSVMLNNFFTSLGIQTQWTAATLNATAMLITYPNNADQWSIVIERNNGDIYYYTQQGIVMNLNGYSSTNSNYAFMCTTVPLGFTVTWGPDNYDYLSIDTNINDDGPSAPSNNMIPLAIPKERRRGIKLDEHSQKRVLLRNEKASKEATPLTIPPPRSSSEVQGLLYDRCLFVYNSLQDKFQGKKVELFIFGSQTSGHSSSGQPDIDLWVVCDESPLSMQETRTILDNLTHEATFKLDITSIDRRILLNRVNFVKFEKH